MITGVTTGVTGVEWLISGGAVILLVGIVVALVTGRLVPRKTHESQVNNVKEVADLWKSTAENKEKSLQVLIPAVDQLVKYAETTDAALTGLRKAVEEIRDDRTGGAEHVKS